MAAIGERPGRLERPEDEGHGTHGKPDPLRRAALDDAEHGHADQHREQEAELLEEREVRSVEVEAEVGARERAREQHGQERPHADGGGDPDPLKQVEDEIHQRRGGRGAYHATVPGAA